MGDTGAEELLLVMKACRVVVTVVYEYIGEPLLLLGYARKTGSVVDSI